MLVAGVVSRSLDNVARRVARSCGLLQCGYRISSAGLA
jgi:hypothetical protein